MENELTFENLYKTVENLNEVFEDNAAKAINRNITARNWLMGFYIINFEQNGFDRAAYGEKVLQTLADRLQAKSLSYRNLRLYRQFYLEFKNLESPIKEFVLTEFTQEQNILPFPATERLIESKDCNLAISDCQIQINQF